jgi:putative endonuclease
MYYIYILFSLKTNKYYVGSTNDLQGRLKHHNGGSTPSTKAEAPDWEILYTETVPDRATALKRELEIKNKKRRILSRMVDSKRQCQLKKQTNPALLHIGVYPLF